MTLDEIKQLAALVRSETNESENTALRVGTVLVELAAREADTQAAAETNATDLATLTAALTTEKSTRSAADKLLELAVSNEAEARQAADAKLQNSSIPPTHPPAA